MENWGLVTYRETCLLVDELMTSTQRKQWIAIIVAHELAHQWFGNLVTMVSCYFSSNFSPKLSVSPKLLYFSLLRNGGLIYG